MERAKNVNAEKKREAIVETATRLFAKLGFQQTPVEKIAEACDISKALIFHYFERKEDILFEVMNVHMELLLTATDSSLYRNIPPQFSFHEFCRKLLHLYVGGANSQKVLLYELGSLPEDQRKEIIAKERYLIDYAVILLNRALLPREIDNRRLRIQVMLFFGMINWSHSWFKSNDTDERDELSEYVAQTTIEALKT